RRLVVDASVARSAGTTENPTSQLCRQFLDAMLTICHKVVMTDDIDKEWRKHGSRYSMSWLAAMQSRRKLRADDPPGDRATRSAARTVSCPARRDRRPPVVALPRLVNVGAVGQRVVCSPDNAIRSGETPGAVLLKWILEVAGCAEAQA